MSPPKKVPTQFIPHHTKANKRAGPVKPLASHRMFFEKCEAANLRCLSDALAGDLDMLCASIEASAAAMLAWARYVQTLRERAAQWPEIGSKPGRKRKVPDPTPEEMLKRY